MRYSIKYDLLGGLPVTHEVLKFSQSNVEFLMGGIAKLIGDNCIIDGCVVTGPSISDGLIVIDNKLTFFEGGTVGTDILVEEIAAQRLYGDGVAKDVFITRKARFGTPGTLVFADLVYLNTLKNERALPGDMKLISCNGAYITANFDGTGLGTNLRLGWAICNGSNGTDDMGGLFVIRMAMLLMVQ
jgi:hypothetical protein